MCLNTSTHLPVGNEQRQIGQAIITLADDHFINGYQAGHLQYMLGYRNRLLSDEDIYHFLANNLLTPFHSNRWNAGYVMGWMITLYEKQMAPPVSYCRGAEQQEVLG